MEMIEEHICMCNELLVFEDDVWQCVTPDCETTTVPSTLLKEIDEYNEAVEAVTIGMNIIKRRKQINEKVK